MARQSRRRNAQPKRAGQRQRSRKSQPESSIAAQPERRVAVLHEAAAAANPFEPMQRFMQAFMPLAWLRPWMAASPAVPKLHVIDRDGSVLVRAEVPGVHVDGTKAKATFKDGVLEVNLPKVDRSRSHHVKY